MKRSRIRPRCRKKVPTVEGDHPKDVKDEMDQLVRDILKLRDSVCFTCPQTENLHVGHLFRRGLETVRWNILNNHLQCDPCNSLHEEEPEHYIGCFVQRFGEAAYIILRTRSRQSHKLSYIELLDTRDGLRRELGRLQRGKS